LIFDSVKDGALSLQENGCGTPKAEASKRALMLLPKLVAPPVTEFKEPGGSLLTTQEQ
jgi:hypothetical protein